MSRGFRGLAGLEFQHLREILVWGQIWCIGSLFLWESWAFCVILDGFVWFFSPKHRI